MSTNNNQPPTPSEEQDKKEEETKPDKFVHYKMYLRMRGFIIGRVNHLIYHIGKNS